MRNSSQRRTSGTSRSRTRDTSPPPVPLDLERALTDLGLEQVRGDGGEVWALCPNPKHDDHRATNWSMRRDNGWHSCFSCQYSGSILTLALKLRFKADVWAALDWIRSFGVAEADWGALPEHIDETSQPRSRRKVEPIKISEARLAMFDEPPDSELAKRHISRESALKYGLRWDSKRESWILPIRDRDGKLIGWQRKTGKRVKNFPLGIEKSLTLFGFHLIVPGQPVVFVESPLDAPRMDSAGVPNAVGTWGAKVSQAQLTMALEHTDTLISALDDDEAGDVGNGFIWRHWRGRRLRFFLYSGDAKDPGEMSDDTKVVRGVERAETLWGNEFPRCQCPSCKEAGGATSSPARSTRTRRKPARSWSSAARPSSSSRKVPARRVPPSPPAKTSRTSSTGRGSRISSRS